MYTTTYSMFMVITGSPAHILIAPYAFSSLTFVTCAIVCSSVKASQGRDCFFLLYHCLPRLRTVPDKQLKPVKSMSS